MNDYAYTITGDAVGDTEHNDAIEQIDSWNQAKTPLTFAQVGDNLQKLMEERKITDYECTPEGSVARVGVRVHDGSPLFTKQVNISG